MTHIINKAIAVIYEKPNLNSPITDEGIYGMSCEILSEINDFYEINLFYGYKGFIKKNNLEEGMMQEYIVYSKFADLLPTPDYKFSSLITLPMGSRINVKEIFNSNFCEVILNDNTIYYTHKKNIRYYSQISNNLRENLIKTAQKYVGTPYRWGGKTPLGIDCSGLTFMSYYMNGYIIYRDANFEKFNNMREIPYLDIQKGDLLFFPGHIGMYLGDDMFIHSTGSFGSVTINSLDPKNVLYSEIHHRNLQIVATLEI
ncbi:MAG: hypothetical protein A2Y17_03195 [Clostridiales bacterium GWF2_38_85]|nr:MAG: hypothetical protein A2Y17_03195 [Clostridiales bacterium GWF2_38_85]